MFMLLVQRENAQISWSQARMQSEVFMQFLRSAKCLGRLARFAVVLAPFLLSSPARAQVTVKLSDFFTQTNLYFRAYCNRFDPSDTSGSTAYSVPSGLIGGIGGGQYWDFSKGPTNEVLRFDYVSPGGMAEAADFPDAKLVEVETVEGGDGSPVYLFFDPITGTGRKVYGFYADLSGNSAFGTLGFTLSPSAPFDPPIVDFPDPITYGAKWNTSTTYQQDFSTNGDPTADDSGGTSAAQQITQSSDFNVEAYGTIVLPDELGGAFGDGLRITEDVTIDVSYDLGLGSGFEHYETDYTRNYYWVMPGYGIVAQLNSTQNTAPPGTNVTRAVAFLRMIETNKKVITTPGGGCTDPAQVADLRIRVNNGVILLTWSKADCANQYVVQYTTTPTDPQSWQPLGDATANLVWQGENISKGPARFYRVVSMK